MKLYRAKVTILNHNLIVILHVVTQRRPKMSLSRLFKHYLLALQGLMTYWQFIIWTSIFSWLVILVKFFSCCITQAYLQPFSMMQCWLQPQGHENGYHSKQTPSHYHEDTYMCGYFRKDLHVCAASHILKFSQFSMLKYFHMHYNVWKINTKYFFCM